jgi:hypothetical protein
MPAAPRSALVIPEDIAMSDKHTKKLRRHQQILKNRHLADINLQAAVHERNRDLDREREEELREAGVAASRAHAKGNASKQQDTFRKLDEIKQKNSHRTRLANERWNRFAGTENGGGRGL